MTISRHDILRSFVYEKFPELEVFHEGDQTRINRNVPSNRNNSLIAVYDDAIYFVGVSDSLGTWHNSMWSEVPITIAHPEFFDTLTKAIDIAIENTKEW